MEFKEKYFKYKQKYLELKEQYAFAKGDHIKQKYIDLKGGQPGAEEIAELRELLLTSDDIFDSMDIIEGRTVFKYLIGDNQLNKVMIKLNNAVPILRRPNHIINSEDFHTVYFSSDIHADYRKYVQMLKSIGMATNIAGYNEYMIQDVEWGLGPGVLLVIVGDLVDGKRSEGKEVEDTVGSFEYLLLAFLYNLRIKARIAGSEILYTIGNHDYHTVITSCYDQHNFLSRYVTDNARLFFNNHVDRQKALLPFYNLNPYYLLSFHVAGVPETACIHGGLHRTHDNYRLKNDVEAAQDAIDEGAPLSSFIGDPLVKESNGDINGVGDMAGALWSKTYAYKSANCDLLTPEDYPFLIVGHCPTSQNDRPLDLMYENQDPAILYKIYEKCSITDDLFAKENHGAAPGSYYNPNAYHIKNANGSIDNFDPANPYNHNPNIAAGQTITESGIGCVVTDCYTDANYAPRIAFVDTALSNGFRRLNEPPVAATANSPAKPGVTKRDNKERYAQFLKLSHTDIPGVAPVPGERYYNKIESVSAGMLGADLPAPVIHYLSPSLQNYLYPPPPP